MWCCLRSRSDYCNWLHVDNSHFMFHVLTSWASSKVCAELNWSVCTFYYTVRCQRVTIVWIRRCWSLRYMERWSCELLVGEVTGRENVWYCVGCWRVWGQGGGGNGCDGLLELIVWGQDGGANECDGLLEIIVWGQDLWCTSCDGLLELILWGLDGRCNGCDGLLELICEGRTADVIVVMVCWS
jgi:hypothetical protein